MATIDGSAASALEAVKELTAEHSLDTARLNRIYRHLCDDLTGRAAGVFVPAKATSEYRMLVEQARFNFLGLVVNSVAQGLFVDGFRASDPETHRVTTSDNVRIWHDLWQANRMDARQAAIYRSAITYGSAYATVLPGDDPPPDSPLDPPGVKVTPYSPLKMVALYDDPTEDEWPDIAMVTVSARKKGEKVVRLCYLYDEEAVYAVRMTGDEITDLTAVPHNLGLVPVVRFLQRYDLDGSRGKVEPLIPLQQQVNQTTFSLLMAQQYGAFRQRYVTGMVPSKDEQGRPVAPFNIAVDTLLTATSPDSKFGEFSQTDLSGYLSSRQSTLLQVSSTAQVPPHSLLTGPGISNISADALAALEAGHRADIAEHQTCLGEGVEQMFRLGALILNDDTGWADKSAQVVWRDTTPRSMSQLADALGKLASQLGIPVKALWQYIPGVTDQDLDAWEAMLEDEDLLDGIRNMGPVQTEPEPADSTAEPVPETDSMP